MKIVNALLSAIRSLLASLAALMLLPLGALIYLYTLAQAAKVDFVAMVATTLLPGLSQVYWIAKIAAETGTPPQPLTLLCQIWLVLFAVAIYCGVRRTPEPLSEQAR